MGTNYYLEYEVCNCCNRGINPKHIGKSSGGWCFALHVYEEDWEDIKIHDLSDWQTEWSKPGTMIKDEYGNIITSERMLEIITDRSWESDREWSKEEYKQNHAEKGPNGLVRAKVDGTHCVGHGPGTYDYIKGEFS